MKRAVDVLASLLGILLFSPILAALALWIKLDSRGPVFYRGLRVGRSGNPFRIFKFRSMVADAEELGGSSASERDSRITRPGKMIRRYKLDEMPQLINILAGDMSLVGPRPEVRKYVEMYTDEEKLILTVRPGLTDWASIWNANEGETLAEYEDPDRAYEEIIRPTKLKLQLKYVRERSLWVDARIIAYTLLKLFRKSWLPRELRSPVA